MTPSELCQMALRLAEERTDGSTPALYLLVERMRPVLVALVEGWAENRPRMDAIEVRQEKLEMVMLGEVASLRAQLSEALAEVQWWDDRARANGWDPYGGQ